MDVSARILELEEQVRVLQQENVMRQNIIDELSGLEEGWWVKPRPIHDYYSLDIHHGAKVVYNVTFPKSML